MALIAEALACSWLSCTLWSRSPTVRCRSACSLQAWACSRKNGASEIQAQIDQIKRKVDALEGGWTGAAKAQFDQLFLNWRHANQENANALISYAEGVAKAANQYATAEQMNQDLLKGY